MAIFELIKSLFKQRWLQQLFYWISIAGLAMSFLMIAGGIFVDQEPISKVIYTVPFTIGFWGLMAFLMRRQLKKDQ